LKLKSYTITREIYADEDEFMKRILVVGAGAQGGPCASILAKDRDVSEIILGDINLNLANKVKEKIGSEKIASVKLDAGDVDEISRAAKGVDAIINLTLTAYDINIMEAALENGAHYIDTSFGEPSLLDIRARDNILSQIIERRPIIFDDEFNNAGLTALLGCGFSPGTVNVTARYICDKLERVNEIRIRLGSRYFKSGENVVSPWAPTWSPFRALWGYAVEPTIFEDGRYKKYPIFACPEEYTFPDPIGKILLTYHQHQEPITLPHFIGKGIKYCDFKYPVDTTAGAFVKMGLASPEVIDIKGVQIVPRDVLLAHVSPPGNLFLNEDETSIRHPYRASVYVVEVKGTQSGEEVEYKVSSTDKFYRTVEEKLGVYEKLGTTIIGVALPAIVGAKMCVEGEADAGVISAECLNPNRFMKMLTEMGAPVKLHEEIKRDVSFR
jgi:saccharopine dehydrogenase (NAD+, L-lysine-forming)